MVIFPNCKINLGLNVISRRPDGFHDIETVFYPVALRDALEIIPAGDGNFNFQSTGLPIPGDTGNNLCIRAYRLLKKEYKLPPVKMHLHKVIPMGAGLGGGSSDGAFTLKLLNHLFGMGLTYEKLSGYAAQLGSDCAFFIGNQPCFAFEKGDRFEPSQVDLSGLTLVIVVPDVHVSTTDAYSAIHPAVPVRSPRELAGLPVGQWKELLVNDFEKVIFLEYPVIGEIKQKMYDLGAVYAAMSGSGSAVYGFFREVPAMKGLFNDCFAWTSKPQ
jgi:4-diphosphocytidyl-2-C-methyl-D-erythritol kinase